MTKLTLTLTLTDGENDGENNVILCSGGQSGLKSGGRESPGKSFEAGRLGPGFRPRPFGPWHRKRWQLSFQLLVYQGITLINPNTIRGVIIFMSRTYMYIKQEFVIFMNPTSISVIRHHFHQQNSYLIRILCMLLDPSSVIGLLWFISIIPLPLSI